MNKALVDVSLFMYYDNYYTLCCVHVHVPCVEKAILIFIVILVVHILFCPFYGQRYLVVYCVVLSDFVHIYTEIVKLTNGISTCTCW